MEPLLWQEAARAKINLVLKVGPRRDDGYHPVATVIHPLDLHDVVRLRVYRDAASTASTGPIDIRTIADRAEVPGGPDNLAWQAVKLLEPVLRDRAAGVRSVEVEIEKRIPVAAGLGGGSADAAAVLRGLNRCLCLRLTDGELGGFAARLGSDVPACLTRESSLCSGRGDVVQPLSTKAFWWVLAHPGGALSTAAVYAEFDRLRADKGIEALFVPDALLAALRRGDPSELPPYLENDLEEAAAALHGGIRPLLREMSLGGAVRALVSGSGPTVYGLVEDKVAAQSLAERMRRVSTWVWWGQSGV